MNNGKYSEAIVSEICGYLTQGDTVKLACTKVGIHQDTFYEWVKVHPEFSDAVKRAKEDYRRWELGEILQSATQGLRTLIEGTEYEEVRTEFVQNPEEPDKPKVRQQVRTKKKILPNATAVIFALTNRDPENWQNRYSTDIRAKVDADSNTKVSLESVPDDLLEQVVKAIRGESD